MRQINSSFEVGKGEDSSTRTSTPDLISDEENFKVTEEERLPEYPGYYLTTYSEHLTSTVRKPWTSSFKLHGKKTAELPSSEVFVVTEGEKFGSRVKSRCLLHVVM
jgi:hypothetical protein